MNNLVSIVIVTFNRLKFTQLTLESIFNNTYYPNYEVIILDNASTDGTQEYLNEVQRTHTEISRIIYLEKNLGKGKATNRGFSLSMGKYLVGLDNDVIVPPNWLKELVNALGTIPNVGWLCINLENIIKSGEKYFDPKYERKFGDIVIQETPSVGGQCVAMKRSVYERLGGYYDNIYYGLEDAEYNVRFRNEGLLTGYLMNVTGYHLGGTVEEKELFPLYHQYKLDTIAGLQRGDFTLARKDISKLMQNTCAKPKLTLEQIQAAKLSDKGQLIKGPGPAVFFIYNGFKHEIPSLEVFNQLGFRWEDVKLVPQSFIDNYPPGKPLSV